MSQSTNKLEVVYVPAEEIQKTERGYTITCPDGTKLSSRSDYLVPKINLEGNKKFYIPYYPLLHEGVKIPEVRHCDLMVVLKNMPMLLLDSRRYKDPEWISSYEMMMAEFEETSQNGMIHLEKLEGLLGAFRIDKKMITFVNDADYTLGIRDLLKRGTGPIVVKSDAGEDMLFISQAIFYVFQSIVTKVNFRIELCEQHHGCIEDFRKAVIDICEILAISKSDTLVAKKTVQSMICNLTKHCSFVQHLKRPKEKHVGFVNSNSADRYALTRYYKETIKHYGLPDFRKLMKARTNEHDCLMLATSMRSQLMLGWMYSVYGKEWPKSKFYMLDVVLDLCEDDCKAELRDGLGQVLDYNDMDSLLDDNEKETNQMEEMDEFERSVFANMGEFGNHWSDKLQVYNFSLNTLCDKSGGLEATYPVIGVLASNYKILPKNVINSIKPPYFLVDKQFASERKKRFGNLCLTRFSNFYEAKLPIFIRSFRLKIAGVESIRLLTTDVMELAELLLVDEKYNKSEIEEQLEKCRNWWGDADATIPIHSFRRFLDECAIYDPYITIVEDMAFTASVERYRKHLTPISFPNHFNEEVMFGSHAALHVFDSVVFNANWKIERCKEHEKCLTDYRQKIIETVQKYESNKLILRKNVEDDITTLKSHCSYRTLFSKRIPRSHAFLLGEYSGFIPHSIYLQCCEKYHLPNLLSVASDVVDSREATMLLRLGWVALFLKTSGVVTKLLDSIELTVLENPIDSFERLWGKLVENESFISCCGFDPVPEESQNEEGESSPSITSSEPTTSEVVKEQGSKMLDGEETSPSPVAPEPTTNGVVEEQGPVNYPDNGLVMVDVENSVPEEVSTPSPSVNDNASTSDTAAASQNDVLAARKARENRRSEKPKISTNKQKLVLPIKSVEDPLEKAKKINENLEAEVQKLQTKLENASGVLKELRKAKDEAEQKAILYESLAKTSESRGQRLNEREKELKQKNKEIEKLRAQLDSQEQRLLKAGEIEKKGKERKKIEADLRTSNKNLQLKNTALEQQVACLSENLADLSESLEAEKEKHNNKQKILTEEIASLKSEIKNSSSQNLAKEQEIAQLKRDADKNYMSFRNINSRLKCENVQQTQTINELNEKNRKLNNCLSSKHVVTPSPSTSHPGPSRRLTTSLRELRRIKDNFERVGKEEIMQNGREMIIELLNLKNDEETREFAEIEFNSLENSVEDYLEVLNLNIQIFKRTNNASKLLAHPNLPKLSKRFMDLYSRLDSQQSGIPDTDCSICYYFRHEHQETIACHRCPRIYHAACLRKWYKESISCEKCPTCRVVLRDPDEYPELA